jgi:hypothetical protein
MEHKINYYLLCTSLAQVLEIKELFAIRWSCDNLVALQEEISENQVPAGAQLYTTPFPHNILNALSFEVAILIAADQLWISTVSTNGKDM